MPVSVTSMPWWLCAKAKRSHREAETDRLTPHILTHQTRQQLHATHTQRQKKKNSRTHHSAHTVGFYPLMEVWLRWRALLCKNRQHSVFLYNDSSWNWCLTFVFWCQMAIKHFPVVDSFSWPCLSHTEGLYVSYTTASSTLLLNESQWMDAELSQGNGLVKPSHYPLNQQACSPVSSPPVLPFLPCSSHFLSYSVPPITAPTRNPPIK